MLLKKAGASEGLERLRFLEVTRQGHPANRSIWRRGITNDWNRHSPLEVIAHIYSVPPLPPIAGRAAANARTDFPDWEHVKITRWDLQSSQVKEIPVNVAQMFTPENPAPDMFLQWGDAVEIPELDHKTNEKWRGLSNEEATALHNALKREVTIVVKGEEHRRTLVPFWNPADGFARTTAKVWRNEIASFWLREVLNLSGLLRTSSDTSHVRIKRVDPETGQKREGVFDLLTPDNPFDNLWLRQGDVIEVPEKS